MENENGSCSCFVQADKVKISGVRPAEISPAAVEIIRSAPVPAKFWATVNETLPNMSTRFRPQLDSTVAFSGINETSACMPMAQAGFQPVEGPVLPITAPSYQTLTAGNSVDPFVPINLAVDRSAVTEMARGLRDMAFSPLDGLEAPAVLAQRGDDESDQTHVPFPGPLPQEQPEWVGETEIKRIGQSCNYEHEGKLCVDRMFEVTKNGKLMTKEQLVGYGLFWRVDEYTGLLAEVTKKTCVYLAEVIHILRYQVRQTFHKKVRYCNAGAPQVLFEIPITEPYWEKLHHLEKLNYGPPQVCFIRATSNAAQEWIKNYIEEYGPDIVDLGQK